MPPSMGYSDFMPASNLFYHNGASIDTLKGNVPMDQAVQVIKAPGTEETAGKKDVAGVAVAESVAKPEQECT